MMDERLDAALRYSQNGWPVLPVHFAQSGVCTCRNPDCRSIAKHPCTSRGLKDASSDEGEVRRFWNEWPAANIGIRTGGESGLVVVDIDPRHGGDESFAELEREFGELPTTVESLTGGGGRHLYFAFPGGEVKNRSNLRPGLDIRADNGYVVAPPSIHISGQRYRWRPGHSPEEIALAKMPAWLIELITRRGSESAPPLAVPSAFMGGKAKLALKAMHNLRVDDANDGSRRLYAAAGIAAKFGLANGVGVATLREYLASAPTPRNWTDDEIQKRLQDAGREFSVHARPAEKVVAALEPYKPFPVEALPDAMRAMVEAVAATTGTEAAFAATGALAIAAGAIGNRFGVTAKKGFSVPVVLWCGLVGKSGTLKSPVLNELTRPLHKIREASRKEYAAAMERFKGEIARHKLAVKEWEKSGAEGEPPRAPKAPTERRVAVNDATTEALAALLDCNPAGLLLVSDELAGWIGRWDRYASGKGSDAPAWLSMHDAGPITVDRKSTGPLYVPRAAVSVCGGIQPGTLARVFGQAEREAGTLARLLLAFPPERVARWTEDEIDADVAGRWGGLLKALVDVEYAGETRYLGLRPDAKAVYASWYDRHAATQSEIVDDDLRAHYSKLRGICLRFAGVLAVVDAMERHTSPGAVEREHVEAAVKIADWFAHESRRIYGMLAEGDEARELRKLAEHVGRLGGAVTPRDLMRSNGRRYQSVDDARAALDSLVGGGLGSWEPTGRGSPRFVLAHAGNHDDVGQQVESRDAEAVEDVEGWVEV